MSYLDNERLYDVQMQRMKEKQKRIDGKFLAKPVRLPPIEVRDARKRDRSMLEKMGDLDHVVSGAWDKITRKVRQKLDMENDYDIVYKTDNVAKNDPRYHVQFDILLDRPYGNPELTMSRIETIKQKYYNWCAQHTREEINELGRPNWWGLPLEEQHKFSEAYIDKILDQAAWDIEKQLYDYRSGVQRYTEWVDTSFGDIDGGGNGEPPYLDPARCLIENVYYDGPNLNDPRNAYMFTGPGLLYNLRLYDGRGNLKRPDPLPEFESVIKRKEIYLPEELTGRVPIKPAERPSDLNSRNEHNYDGYGGGFDDRGNYHDNGIDTSSELGPYDMLTDEEIFGKDVKPVKRESIDIDRINQALGYGNYPGYERPTEDLEYLADKELLDEDNYFLSPEFDPNDDSSFDRFQERRRKEKELELREELLDSNDPVARAIAEAKSFKFDTEETIIDESGNAKVIPISRGNKSLVRETVEAVKEDIFEPIGERVTEPEEVKVTEPEEIKGEEVKDTVDSIEPVKTLKADIPVSKSITADGGFKGYMDLNMSAYKKQLLEELPSEGPGEVFRVLQNFKGCLVTFQDIRFLDEMKKSAVINFNTSINRRNRYKSRKFIQEQVGFFPVFLLVADGKFLDDYEYFLKMYNKCVPPGSRYLFVTEMKSNDVIVDADKWQDLERFIDTGVDNKEISKCKSIEDLEYVERGDLELVFREELGAEDILDIYIVAI
ncbi:hypothetical protein UT300012_21340 [Paraclostridium bifermentans]